MHTRLSDRFLINDDYVSLILTCSACGMCVCVCSLFPCVFGFAFSLVQRSADFFLLVSRSLCNTAAASGAVYPFLRNDTVVFHSMIFFASMQQKTGPVHIETECSHVTRERQYLWCLKYFFFPLLLWIRHRNTCAIIENHPVQRQLAENTYCCLASHEYSVMVVQKAEAHGAAAYCVPEKKWQYSKISEIVEEISAEFNEAKTMIGLFEDNEDLLCGHRLFCEWTKTHTAIRLWMHSAEIVGSPRSRHHSRTHTHTNQFHFAHK